MEDIKDILPTIRMLQGAVELIDQTLLPGEYRVLRIETVDLLCEAIAKLRIRGAPALGVAGAYGLLLAVEEAWPQENGYYFDMEGVTVEKFPDVDVTAVREVLDAAGKQIVSTRPTAVNLSWAVGRMKDVYAQDFPGTNKMLERLHKEAIAIYEEDVEMCMAIGRHGAELLKDGDNVMTHCNTGGLATSGFGTALGVVFAAVGAGKKIHVYADETRPLLQGARLNAWECEQRGIPVSVLCDGAVASIMSRGMVSCVIVGADRIASNGDTANKIGTLNLAIVARHYGVPFYIAAPSSTIDRSIPDGDAIPIEERAEEEVKQFKGVTTVPTGARAVNPAFDVTTRDLIAGFITEEGVVQPPFLPE
ncbi:MAG: S-methyl-5-thioribose-1-phosphate isomerase [bacterium]|nr:S-methyl-5-thioribose-1-phosphate isomerase [bacterium]